MATTPQIDLLEPAQAAPPSRSRAPKHPTPVAEIVAALREIQVLDGLTEEEYTWLAIHGNELVSESGDLIFREGEAADALSLILRGEINVRRYRSGSVMLFIGRAGQMTGKLPFSRMKTFGGDGYAVGSTWGLNIPETMFPDMMLAIPSMAQRSVSVLLDRVRDFTRLEQQSEKLTALGKLAGNLAHELNNPASAAQRSAASLFTELADYGSQKFHLGALGLTEQVCSAYRGWVSETRSTLTERPLPLEGSGAEALANADREDTILRWLEDHNVPDPWKIAPSLAETTIGVHQLNELALIAAPDVLPLATAAFASALRVERMAETVLNSTVRIFDLISAIKDYSYMDQAPIQEVDLAQSLENTITMFKSRLRGILIEVHFDPDLPTIRAYGSELNQVWTALIENALEAIDSNATRSPDAPRGTIRLSTKLSGRYALIEIADSGPGIPDSLRSRIFEPFFTTKAPGQGLGLGLDTVQRVVGKHTGIVSVDTSQGSTCFQVRLPLDQAEAF